MSFKYNNANVCISIKYCYVALNYCDSLSASCMKIFSVIRMISAGDETFQYYSLKVILICICNLLHYHVIAQVNNILLLTGWLPRCCDVPISIYNQWISCGNIVLILLKFYYFVLISALICLIYSPKMS